MVLAFFRFTATFAVLCLIAPLASDRARADVYISVSKASQRMTVMVDGKPRYNWAISSGLNGGSDHPGRGTPASHGCVRLHPSNAATLFALVKQHGMGRTTIAVSDFSPRMAYR